MKLKILIFPLMIVVIMYLAIWVIVPKYKATDSIKAKLSEVNMKLDDIRGKEQNALSLVASLSNNAEDQTLIVKYLPEKKQDENILAGISAIASASGTVISSMAFSEDEPIQDVETLYDDLGNPLPPQTDPLKKVSVEISLKGSYDQIRQFIFSVAQLNRQNNFMTLSIGKGEGDDVNNLEAKVAIDFSYLERVEAMAEINEDFFASGEFDTSVAQEIRKKAGTDIPQIDIGAIGRGNPFSL